MEGTGWGNATRRSAPIWHGQFWHRSFQRPNLGAARDPPTCVRWCMPSSKHCPLPTPEERLFCMLASVKPSTLHVVQGGLLRLGQRQAKQWLHVLLPALRAALRPLNGQAVRTGAAA